MAKSFKIFLIILSLACIIGYALPCLSAEDKIVAIVNTDIITQKDLDDFLNFMRLQLAGEFRGRELENKIQSIKEDLLDKLIEDRLILQEAQKMGIRIDESRVQAKVDEIKAYYNSDLQFQHALRQQGLVQADLEKKIRNQLLMFMVLEIKIRSRIIVNPKEVTDFYEKNPKEFFTPEERQFQVITFDDENLFREISRNIYKYKILEDLARDYSLPVNKLIASKNGELRSDIVEEVFKLRPQEINGPIKLDYSYYIFQLDEIIPPRQLSLSEAQDSIQAYLYELKFEEDMVRWLDELKAGSYIKIM